MVHLTLFFWPNVLLYKNVFFGVATCCWDCSISVLTVTSNVIRTVQAQWVTVYVQETGRHSV